MNSAGYGMKIASGIVLLLSCYAMGAVADFEDMPLAAESYWNGSEGSGGFVSGGAFFSNNYSDQWGSWDGFAYSNRTDTQTSGLAGQYTAIAGGGQGGSANYGVGYIGYSEPPRVVLDTAMQLDGMYVTNVAYPYYSMRDGDAFSKKFGIDDSDWFLLTVTGKDSAGAVTGIQEFYLADFRLEDAGAGHIVDSWEFVDLSSLGAVKSLEFGMSSSDVGQWGMNTPGYFAIDTVVPEPATVALLGLGWVLARRRD